MENATWKIVHVGTDRVWLEESRTHKVVCVPQNVIGETWKPEFQPGDAVWSEENKAAGVVASLQIIETACHYNVAFGNRLVRCGETDLTGAKEQDDE